MEGAGATQNTKTERRTRALPRCSGTHQWGEKKKKSKARAKIVKNLRGKCKDGQHFTGKWKEKIEESAEGREKKKPGVRVDVQTPNQTALHPLTPSREESGKMRGERWRGEESALEVLKLDFFYSFLKKERSIGRRDGRCSEEEEDTGANLLKQVKGMSESDESRWKCGAETMCSFLCCLRDEA